MLAANWIGGQEWGAAAVCGVLFVVAIATWLVELYGSKRN